MLPVEIKPSIHWVGVNDRHSEFFEGLWPIREEGVSYNSYLINDDKKAIIDLSSLATAEDLLESIQTITDPAGLDYIIINHLEPDHSGALKLFRMLAPQAKLVCSAKCAEMLGTFYGINDSIQIVKDGDTLDLGKHQLRFFATPFVHWPETMMTYEVSEKVLFSCDGFGGYGALDGSLFDDQCTRLDWYKDQALRYYVNIISSFSRPVKNAIAKLTNVPIAVLAPSHGLVWRSHPESIIELYGKWASYALEAAPDGVTLLYASMYGNTKKMMETVAQGIADTGMPVEVFNVQKTHVSYILSSLWTKKGVVIGAPTYEGELFPVMGNVLHMAKHKHIVNKVAAGFGSCAWLGGGQRQLESLMETLNWQFSGSLEWKGAPELADLQQGREFGADFARKVAGFTLAAPEK
jgi:anaerobic nitric oxide reductase flavorubredoxin